jgi:predicted glycoside hydrolase/deacetylase ChbG (UPF0249 family)
MIRIVFRADDIGISASSVAAAHIAVTQGLARNLSVQAVGGDHLDAVRERLVGLPGVLFGLHATINCEWSAPRIRPLLGADRVPALCDPDGAFAGNAVIQHQRGVPLVEEVLAEVSAQLARLRERRIPVAYLDEHMGFGWLPGVQDALADLCRREGLIRAGAVPSGRMPKPAVEQQGHPERLLAQLAAAEPGTYVVVGHPCLPDDEMRSYRMAGDPAHDTASDRDGQRRMFTDPRILDLARSGRIQAIRYDQV